jgi:hypothetical protein
MGTQQITSKYGAMHREDRTQRGRTTYRKPGVYRAIATFVVVIGILPACTTADDTHAGATGSSPTLDPSSSGGSDTFKAPFSYTLPPGWTIEDGARYFKFDMADTPGAHFYVLSSVVAAKSDCSNRPKRGVGTSSDAMTSWLSTHPALDATTPRPVTLGAAMGSYVDVQLAADWNMTCPNGLALVTRAPDGPQGWGIGTQEKIRFYVLDLPGGDTVTVVVEAPFASAFQDVIDQAAPVVESFNFLK